jgi:hypothetical protein
LNADDDDLEGPQLGFAEPALGGAAATFTDTKGFTGATLAAAGFASAFAGSTIEDAIEDALSNISLPL